MHFGKAIGEKWKRGAFQVFYVVSWESKKWHDKVIFQQEEKLFLLQSYEKKVKETFRLINHTKALVRVLPYGSLL